MSQADITLSVAAKRLRHTEEDVAKASQEVLNKQSAVMFSQEEVEQLQSHFSEIASASKGRRKLKLKQASSSQPNSTSAGKTHVHVERRKQRGVRVAVRHSTAAAPAPRSQLEPAPKATASPAPVKAAPMPASVPNGIEKKPSESLERSRSIYESNTLTEKKVEEESQVAIEEPAPVERPPVRHDRPRKPAPPRQTLSADPKAAESVAQRRRKRRRSVNSSVKREEFVAPTSQKVLNVEVSERNLIRDLAARMSVKSDEIFAKLSELGEMSTEIEELDRESASLIVEMFNHKTVMVTDNRTSEFEAKVKSAQGKQISQRTPVVTIMGHVDHGKTSLLDHIRKSRVAASESGGITQHIGAYQVETENGPITFIDTPGHEVFSAMRARGANVTDIVVLVVAADDGVKPQTVEAIEHARAAGVEIIVAVNKMDLPDVDPDSIMKQLSSQDLVPEEWGGTTMFVKISALTGENVAKLLESITLAAEVLELKAATDIDAHGIVIEANKEKGLGTVLTAIVKNGRLSKGQFLLCDTAYGRIRQLRDENDKPIIEALPSQPVQILGISDLPRAGSEFFVADSEALARAHAEERKYNLRQHELANSQTEIQADSFEELLALQKNQEEAKVLNLIVKTDVVGTLEAMQQALSKIGNDGASVKVVLAGIGAITESDVNLARASDATLLGFKVSANAKSRGIIKDYNLDSAFFDVFYEATDYVKAKLEGMLKPLVVDEVRGAAEVKEIFSIHKLGKIAGCTVVEGMIDAKLPSRIVRDGLVINKAKITELRHFKQVVQTIKAGSDCGVFMDRFRDFKPGDRIESYEEITTQQKL